MTEVLPEHMDRWSRNQRLYETLRGMGLYVSRRPLLGAISGTRTQLCLIALWPLSRCHAYKTREILSVIGIGVGLGQRGVLD